ncbi:MAG: DUF2950 domain-containing protein [Betaproteobacteria bacterium]|nr:DUF2950 domain-containing protein [Betaproteobacteria bacterium]
MLSFPALRIPMPRLIAAITLVAAGWLVSTTTLAATPKQATFESPEAAADALVAALKANDESRLLTLFGPQGGKLIGSGDTVADEAERAKFVTAFEEAHKIEMRGDTTAMLNVGKDDWPLPIPIVKRGTVWRFDADKGLEELLNRRIGKNELYTIQVLLAIVDAQREYSAEDRNGDGRLEYARRFRSQPGKTDGLYWPAADGKPESPLGPLAATASREGYKSQAGQRMPFHGYYFRILTAQGKDAPGGAYSYLANGHMIGGFAIVAWPAKYGASGIMTFIVNQDGVVYEKNLGPNTAQIAGEMRLFNPAAGWSKVESPI